MLGNHHNLRGQLGRQFSPKTRRAEMLGNHHNLRGQLERQFSPKTNTPSTETTQQTLKIYFQPYRAGEVLETPGIHVLPSARNNAERSLPWLA